LFAVLKKKREDMKIKPNTPQSFFLTKKRGVAKGYNLKRNIYK
jgi:hypothetical protein